MCCTSYLCVRVLSCISSLPFCGWVALSITRQPVHVCIWHRYLHLSTCPVWLLGSSKIGHIPGQFGHLYLLQNGVINSIKEGKTLCFTSTCAPIATSSARFCRSDGATKCHGSKSWFQLSSTYSSLCQNYYSSYEHHLVTSSGSPFYQYLNLYLSTDLYDYPLLVSVSIHKFISLSLTRSLSSA